MTDTSAPARPYKTGRKPQHPPEERYAIPYLHELDLDLNGAVTFPVDVSEGITEWRMLGNGPEDPNDPVTVPMPAGDSPETGEGDCHWAGWGHDTMLAGALPTANQILTAYNAWSAQSQGVPPGQEQDEGTNMGDALVWGLTHDETGAEVPLGQGMVTLFAPLHPATLGAAMQKYGRGVLMGVNCTDADQANFPHGWVGPPTNQPDPQDGHVVYLVVLNADGSAVVVSWGQKVPADPSWMGACPEEYWILLTPADRAKLGDAAYNQLAAIMATLPGVQGQTTPPAPGPAPAPKPPPNPVIDGPPPAPPVPAVPAPDSWLAEVREWYDAARAWWDHHFGEKEEA